MSFAKWSAFLLVCFALVFPSTAVAESPSLAGEYELDKEESDDMVEAFEPAISEMSRFRRGFARRAIRREDGPGEVMRIEQSDDEVVIEHGDNPAMTIPLNGKTVDHTDGDGDVEQISARVENGVLKTHTRRDEGEYTTEYHLSSDGRRLDIVMEMHFDRLPKAVDYRLVYRRK